MELSLHEVETIAVSDIETLERCTVRTIEILTALGERLRVTCYGESRVITGISRADIITHANYPLVPTCAAPKLLAALEACIGAIHSALGVGQVVGASKDNLHFAEEQARAALARAKGEA